MTIKTMGRTVLQALRDALSDALRASLGMSGQRALRPLGLLGSFAILIVVSFTMLWLGDKLNASGMVLTRFMARVQAPLTAQFNYPPQARDQITVVMYDQEFLAGSASAWPISYQDHGDALLRLASDPNARPKAIMLDITFGQERSDPTLPSLAQALCTIQNELKVPVFLAALPSPRDGRLAVRAGLGGDTAGAAPACFTLVGVDYLPDPLDGLAWSYQLSRHLTDAGWQPGPATAPLQPAYRSAAMAIAEDAAQIDLGQESVPMALIWGHNSAPQSDRPERLAHCRPGARDWLQLMPGVLRQFWEDGARLPLCPYHQTLSMAQLGVLSEAEVAPYLAGRYVFVGANVPGFNDFADSPVHRVTPGVYMHAMALDNLLTYQGNYKLSEEWSLPPPWALLWPGLLTILAVFVVHLGWLIVRVKLAQRFLEPPWVAHCECATSPPRTRTRQLLPLLLAALVWLGQIALKTVAAMVLIGLLQDQFRIGMLPVVELVGMTLVAEGLGYMTKVQAFLFGDKRP